jgi:hypothetical protein
VNHLKTISYFFTLNHKFCTFYLPRIACLKLFRVDVYVPTKNVFVWNSDQRKINAQVHSWSYSVIEKSITCNSKRIGVSIISVMDFCYFLGRPNIWQQKFSVRYHVRLITIFVFFLDFFYFFVFFRPIFCFF